VNYFLRNKQGKFLNGIRDKHVWVKWMELRIHGEAKALVAPTGLIPEYEVLVPLFKQLVGKDYAKEDYIAQFTLRVPENIAKIDRVIEYHRTKVERSPEVLFTVLAAQKARLEEARAKHGDYISPELFPREG